MMMRTLALTALITLLGCDEATRAVDDAARRSAKLAVSEAVATRFPAVPKELITPFTDCVIDNASANEIRTFARDAVIGVTEETATLVRTVIERPETQSCLLSAGANALGTA